MNDWIVFSGENHATGRYLVKINDIALHHVVEID